jgi:hypothetical protein
MTETKMTRTGPFLAALALLAVSAPAAQANFFFEGLEPFSARHCVDVDPTLRDPRVIPPPAAVTGTPGAWILDGERPFSAPPCGGTPGKIGAPLRHHAPPSAVPQK